jgi:hypothetical protein
MRQCSISAASANKWKSCSREPVTTIGASPPSPHRTSAPGSLELIDGAV